MNRRGVLKGLGVAAAAAFWPGWAREAHAGPLGGLLGGASTLISAIERARARNQPLLVLVIPEDDRAKYSRGRHFGQWLTHGDDADLAPLACADLVCAGMDAVRALFPGSPVDGEPAILLLDADPSPRPSVVLSAFSGASTTGAAVSGAIFGDVDAVKRRAGERWSLLTSEVRAEVRRIYDGVDGSPEVVLAAAPVFAVDAVEGNTEALRLLARAARVRSCGQSIPGSEWAETEVGQERFLYFPTRAFQNT
ncbi:MAG TPA: hypothetical protein VFA20_09900 [Myxococcaceae bacterium]|nr:hypothetical protein [Myxococcaceae bacterium]